MLLLALLVIPLVPAKAKAKVYIVSVGASRTPGMKALNSPRSDAAAMCSVYDTNSEATSVLLVDDKATVAGVAQAMTKLFAQAEAEDIVLLFFSGHGNDEGFLCSDGVISYKQMWGIISKSKSKNKMVFADACYAGTMRNSVQHSGDTPGRDENIMLFMSCRNGERSIEKKSMSNGLFTHALTQGLKGKADANKDKTVTAKELYSYVSSSVRKMSRERQHPVMWGRFADSMPVINN